jgi:RimJ/RimL family protein N-acetyltransferase
MTKSSLNNPARSDSVVNNSTLSNPVLTDGVIFLRPHTPDDAAAHLAGEDDAMAKWLNGGRGTPATVAAFIESSQNSWGTGGARRPLGVFACGTHELIGFVEAHLAMLPDPAQVNVSYGVFAKWRGQGIALRAINLMEQYLRSATDKRQIVLQISPENAASIRVAEKGGFTFLGVFEQDGKLLARYVREIKR